MNYREGEEGPGAETGAERGARGRPLRRRLASPRPAGPDGRAARLLFAGLMLAAAACGPEPDPPPESHVGKACEHNFQCGRGESCLTHLPGGVCSRACDEGCPAGSVCVTLGSDDVCLAACAGPGDCRDGYGCVEGACRPEPGCGGLPAEGVCDGALLTWCDDWQLVEVDCSQYDDGTGIAMTCGRDFDGTASCMAQAMVGCATVPPEGRCDGNAVLYCASRDTGVVRREPCAEDEVCRVGTDGRAACVHPGTEGCGTVGTLGRCDGTEAVWCADSELRRYDCAAEGQRCDWVDDAVGYWCVPLPTGSLTVSGVFQYTMRPVDRTGLGDPRPAPMRRVTVQVRKADGTLVASGHTDDTGHFEVPFEASGEVFVAPLTLSADERYAFSVRDCPTDDCPTGGLLYGGASPTFGTGEADPEGRIDLGTLTLEDPSGAGAFHIFDVLLAGFDFAVDTFGRRPPHLIAQWRTGAGTICASSCYSPYSRTIYVGSTFQDSDEWDDPVIAHEFGHFLEDAYSRSDSPGGYHDGSPTDPRLAWSEGYGTWVGASIHGSRYYVDTYASGTMVVDLAYPGIERPDPQGALSQKISEFAVSEILWRVAHGGPEEDPVGPEPVFDVMGTWFKDEDFADRGVKGVDLVDLLDGWFCRGHDHRDVVEAVVNDRMGFPYDYAGPTQCL